VLRTLASFTEAKLGNERLMIVVGDHQPAPMVAGQGTGLQVPVHIVGPAGLLAPLDAWDWTPAAIPADDAPVWSMAAFRDRFLETFSGVQGGTVAARMDDMDRVEAAEHLSFP